MDISIMIEGQDGLNWERWKKIVAAVEDLGFAGLFRSDHFTNANAPDKDSLELWVSLTYLADHTERIHFGQLVSPASFRHPGFLARQGAALDDLSGGRMILGMGAGWQEREHQLYGFELGDVTTRMSRLEEATNVVSKLLASDEPVSFEGTHYRIQGATLLPRPNRKGGPPINIGGNGIKRTLAIAARFAGVWNAIFLSPEDFRERVDLLDQMLQSEGRSPSDVKKTMMLGYYPQVEQEHPNLLTGSAERAAEQLRRFEEVGLEEVMVQWLDQDNIEGLEKFARAVL